MQPLGVARNTKEKNLNKEWSFSESQCIKMQDFVILVFMWVSQIGPESNLIWDHKRFSWDTIFEHVLNGPLM